MKRHVPGQLNRRPNKRFSESGSVDVMCAHGCGNLVVDCGGNTVRAICEACVAAGGANLPPKRKPKPDIFDGDVHGWN